MSSGQIKLPDYILGTVQLGMSYGINNTTGAPGENEAMSILQTAYEHGVRSIDTADSYGKSLELVAKAASLGLQFRIFTKIKPDVTDIKGYLIELKNRLGRHTLEGVSLHSQISNFSTRQIEDLISAKKQGMFRYLGVSVYCAQDALHSIVLPDINLIQLPFNLLDGWTEKGEVLKQLKKAGKTIHIRSVFLQGLFFQDLPKGPGVILADQLQSLKDFSNHWPGGVGQLAIDYVRSNDYIDGVLLGAETTEQVRTNCQQWFKTLNAGPYFTLPNMNETQRKALDPRNWT